MAATAISLALTGAVAQASPATSLAAPNALTASSMQHSASEWVSTTDPDSGISVMLPGQPTINKNTVTAAGKSIPMRTYVRKFTKDNAAAVFVVMDFPAGAGPVDYDAEMKDFIQGFTSTSGTKASMTSSRRFDFDGHPAADGRFTFTADKGDSGVGFIRLVSDGNHAVTILTMGEASKETTLTRIHQKMLSTLELS